MFYVFIISLIILYHKFSSVIKKCCYSAIKNAIKNFIKFISITTSLFDFCLWCLLRKNFLWRTLVIFLSIFLYLALTFIIMLLKGFICHVSNKCLHYFFWVRFYILLYYLVLTFILLSMSYNYVHTCTSPLFEKVFLGPVWIPSYLWVLSDHHSFWS